MRDQTKIVVPLTPEQVDVCSRWYDGSGSMFYAIASTGALSRGTIRPYGTATDGEWSEYLASCLESEAAFCAETAEQCGDPDAEILREIEAAAAAAVERFSTNG